VGRTSGTSRNERDKLILISACGRSTLVHFLSDEDSYSVSTFFLRELSETCIDALIKCNFLALS
jgi:hypothetical protein